MFKTGPQLHCTIEAPESNGVQRHFQQNFSYIVAVSFIGGGNWSTQRKPLTCRKSLTNFITYCCIKYTSPILIETQVLALGQAQQIVGVKLVNEIPTYPFL
jgi:hypothetical protein